MNCRHIFDSGVVAGHLAKKPPNMNVLWNEYKKEFAYNLPAGGAVEGSLNGYSTLAEKWENKALGLWKKVDKGCADEYGAEAETLERCAKELKAL